MDDGADDVDEYPFFVDEEQHTRLNVFEQCPLIEVHHLFINIFCDGWELNCGGLVSHPGGIKDSHPLNTTETGDKRRLHQRLGSGKGFSFIYFVMNKKN